MNEQISLFGKRGGKSSGKSIAREKEAAFYQTYRARFLDVVQAYSLPEKMLQLNQYDEYTSLAYRDAVVFSLKFGPKAFWLSVGPGEAEYLKDYGGAFDLVPGSGRLRVPLADETSAAQYVDYLVDALNRIIVRYPKEFSCCSRYLECSDAGHCVNPNPDLPAECSYNYTLQSNRVFYGQNRNI